MPQDQSNRCRVNKLEDLPPDDPIVSVIVRTIGHPKLQRALKSAAGQTYQRLEIVLVLARPGLVVPTLDSLVPIRAAGGEKALSRAQACNIGLSEARGELAIFLDEDDEWDDTHLAGLMHDRGRDQNLAHYCDTRLLDRDGQIKAKLGGPYKAVRLYTAGIFCMHACLFSISLVRTLGLRFDAGLPMYEDTDFWIQLEPHVQFRYVPQCTAIWHGEEGNSGAGIGRNSRRDGVLVGRRELLDKWRHRIAERGGSSEELIAVGRELAQKSLWSDAVGVLQALLVRHPNWLDALNLAGLAYLRLGQPEFAIVFLRRALDEGEHYGVRYNLALCYEALGMNEAALQQATLAISLAPQFSPARELLGRLPS